jgi:hypothetical protein
MLVAHCASITKKIRLGTAVVVLPLYNPARLRHYESVGLGKDHVKRMVR